MALSRIFSALRKRIANAAIVLFLMTVSPTIAAMSFADPRLREPAPIVIMYERKRRSRALERQYGAFATSYSSSIRYEMLYT